MDIFTVGKMKTVVVPVHPVVNSYTICIYLFATQYAEAMVSAGPEENITHTKIGTLIKDSEVRTVEIATNAILTRTSIISLSIIKSEAVSIYCSFSFNRNILCIYCIQKNNIAIARRHAFTCSIIFTVRTAQ